MKKEHIIFKTQDPLTYTVGYFWNDDWIAVNDFDDLKVKKIKPTMRRMQQGTRSHSGSHFHTGKGIPALHITLSGYQRAGSQK